MNPDLKQDGGPAFPVPIPTEVIAELRRQGRQDVITSLCSGLTKRDFFASAALTGLLANTASAKNMEEGNVPHEVAITTTAKHAYEVADAMLTRRNNEREK